MYRDDPINQYKECVREVYSGYIFLFMYKSSQWPYEESIIRFFQSNDRVYQNKGDQKWSYLRNTCLDISTFQLYLYQASSESANHYETIQSLNPNEVVSPSTSSSWIVYIDSDMDVLLQQIGLLHSVAIHPDQFPPVGIGNHVLIVDSSATPTHSKALDDQYSVLFA